MVNEENSVIHVLEQHVYTCIKYHNYREAIFTAERIFAENSNEHVIYLLATCYYLDKQPKKTKTFLLQQDSKDYRCRHLLAQCFMDIGNTIDAENSLLDMGQETMNLHDIVHFYKEAAPSVLLMLADIFKTSGRKEMAKSCFKTCIEVNPLFWTSFTGLIDLGENVNPNDLFVFKNELIVNNASMNVETNLGKISYPNSLIKEQLSAENPSAIRDTAISEDNFSNSDSWGYSFNRTGSRNENSGDNKGNFRKPKIVFGIAKEQKYNDFIPAISTPLNHRRADNIQVNPSKNFKPRNSKGMISPLAINKSIASLNTGSKISRLSDDFSDLRNSSKVDKSSNERNSEFINSNFQTKSVTSKLHYETESAEIHLRLLTLLGECYRALVSFKCKQAIDFISILPKSQKRTALVNSWLGTAFIELNNQNEAIEVLSSIPKCEPWQLYGMVTYSNQLWKDKDQNRLLYLAKHISELDRESPEYWCILGNSMSSNGEREIALQFFLRAVQICPTYSYAHILLAHEYVDRGELNEALNSYKRALMLNPTQHQSYCGMAFIFTHLGNLHEAHETLMQGLRINPNSSIMLTALAVVNMGQPELYTQMSVLDLLERACTINPNDASAKYQKAVLLYEMEKYLESLEILKLLHSGGNKDEKLFILMSINYSKLGDTTKALLYSNLAKGTHLNLQDNSFDFACPSTANSLMANDFSIDESSNFSGMNTSSSRRSSIASRTNNIITTHSNSEYFSEFLF